MQRRAAPLGVLGVLRRVGPALEVLAHQRGVGVLELARARLRRRPEAQLPPPSRTNWTRLVPPPVLTGRVWSLPPY